MMELSVREKEARTMNTNMKRPEVVAAKLRGGAGVHADRRTRRERSRGDRDRKAIRLSARGE